MISYARQTLSLCESDEQILNGALVSVRISEDLRGNSVLAHQKQRFYQMIHLDWTITEWPSQKMLRNLHKRYAYPPTLISTQIPENCIFLTCWLPQTQFPWNWSLWFFKSLDGDGPHCTLILWELPRAARGQFKGLVGQSQSGSSIGAPPPFAPSKPPLPSSANIKCFVFLWLFLNLTQTIMPARYTLSCVVSPLFLDDISLLKVRDVDVHEWLSK